MAAVTTARRSVQAPVITHAFVVGKSPFPPFARLQGFLASNQYPAGDGITEAAYDKLGEVDRPLLANAVAVGTPDFELVAQCMPVAALAIGRAPGSSAPSYRRSQSVR